MRNVAIEKKVITVRKTANVYFYTTKTLFLNYQFLTVLIHSLAITLVVTIHMCTEVRPTMVSVNAMYVH